MWRLRQVRGRDVRSVATEPPAEKLFWRDVMYRPLASIPNSTAPATARLLAAVARSGSSCTARSLFPHGLTRTFSYGSLELPIALSRLHRPSKRIDIHDWLNGGQRGRRRSRRVRKPPGDHRSSKVRDPMATLAVLDVTGEYPNTTPTESGLVRRVGIVMRFCASREAVLTSSAAHEMCVSPA